MVMEKTWDEPSKIITIRPNEYMEISSNRLLTKFIAKVLEFVNYVSNTYMFLFSESSHFYLILYYSHQTAAFYQNMQIKNHKVII